MKTLKNYNKISTPFKYGPIIGYSSSTPANAKYFTSANINLPLNSIELDRVDSFNDLGVIIDKDLKFQEHIQSKINKANSIMGTIRT
jgi:hypothetical protein